MPDFPALIDLTNLGSYGFKLQGDAEGDEAGYSVSSAGDVNGDGYEDFIVGAAHHDPGRETAGAVYVIFGKAGGFGPIDLGSLAPADGFKISGAVMGDSAGDSVSSGDINGDGYSDVIVGAPFADDGGAEAGATYVIFGKAAGLGNVDLLTLADPDGFKVLGDAPGDIAGASVSAGDVNGDGFDDLIIGAAFNDSGGYMAGAAYVVFGKASGFGTVDLAALAAGEGFKIVGDAPSDIAGFDVSSAGDVNGDGFDDILVGAQANDSGGFSSGAVYLIFGKSGGFGTIDLANLAAADGFRIRGGAVYDLAGRVASAGDVNGDGFNDIIIGARGNSGSRGAAYVIFGKAGGFGPIDLGALAPADGVKIQGEVGYGEAGVGVASAGDVNGDGFDDVIIGARGNDSGGNDAGAAYVLFGKASGFGLADLGALDGTDGFKIQGDVSLDRAGVTVSSAGDINGDGFDDVMVGATGNDSGGSYAGAAYVIFGIAPTTGVVRIGSAADQTISGGAGDDTLDGAGGNDILVGAGGVDSLIGGAGADMLDGGAGADTMTGGLGDDVFIVDSQSDVVQENAGEGTDEIRTALDDYVLYFFENVENLTGLGDVDQTLTGNARDNVIDGGLGADSMNGLTGNDIYIVDDPGDAVFEGFGEGNDEVRTALASLSIAAFTNVEKLTGLGSGDQTLTGNDRFNVIDGGLGADAMAGGLGSDTYIVDNVGDTITETGDDFDMVITNAASYSIAPFAGVEALIGGAADQILTGNDGDNHIEGGAGADAMSGGGGNDVYVVDNFGDSITELDGAGTDGVRTSIGTRAQVYVMPDFVENLLGTLAGAQAVEGNAASNVITMAGGGNDLVVLHDGGDDTTNGAGGNDYIYFGATLTAADKTNGGDGVDTIGLLGSTTVTFAADSLTGVERIAVYTGRPSLGGPTNNYSLTMVDQNVAAGAELFVTAKSLQAVETFFFNGSAELDGRFTIVSGAGNDTIVGGAKNDYLAGNGGADILYGLAGTDSLYGGAGGDQMRGGAGQDFFHYQSATDSIAGAMDAIIDFTSIDRINLSTIDAISGTPGNDAFAFIGANAFTNTAGQLRAYQSGADWFVEGDVNGDGLADLLIQVTVTDASAIVAGNFIL